MASPIMHNMTHAMQQAGSDMLAQGRPHFSFASVGDEFVGRMGGAGKPGPLETISIFFKRLWYAIKDVFTGGRASLERQLQEEIALARAQQERLQQFNHAIVTSVDTLIRAENPEKVSRLMRDLAGILIHPEQQEAARKAIIDHHHTLPALSDTDAKMMTRGEYREAVIKLFEDLPGTVDSEEALTEMLRRSLQGYPPECLARFDALSPEELKSLTADVRAGLKPALESFKANIKTFFNKGIVQEQLHPFVQEYAAQAGQLLPETLEKTGEALESYFTGTLAERTLMGEIVRERWSELKKSGQEAAERLAKLEKAAKKTAAKGAEPSLEAEAARQTAEKEYKSIQEEQRNYKEALTALLKHLEPKNPATEEDKIRKVGFDKLAAQINATLADEPPWWVGLGKLGASIGLSGVGDSLLSPYLGIYATPFIGSIARHYAESAPIGQTGRRFAVDAAGYAAAYRLFPDSPMKRFAFQIATAIGNSKLDGYAPLESWENQATSYWNDLWARMFGT
jgi:hypothetical protein